MQHDFLWFGIDWSTSAFISTLIIVAFVGGVIAFVIDRIWRRASWSDNRAGYYLLALALAWVVYEAVAWDVASWVLWVFRIVFWVAVIASLLALVPVIHYLVNWLARILTGIVWFILLLLLVLIPLLWNTWAPDGNTYRDSDATGLDSESASVPVVTPSTLPSSGPSVSTTPVPSSGPSVSTSPSTIPAGDCTTWEMYSETPSQAIWITQLAIRHADTGRQAFQAFKYGWYDWAIDYYPVLNQLSRAVLHESWTRGTLVIFGHCAAPNAVQLTNRLANALKHASYSAEPGAVRITLRDNVTTFRIMARTGQVVPN